MTREITLNNEQRKAVEITDGPLLIVAGPGTGKTQLLSARTANIVRKKKALPENILILTFTNAAAGAMRERLAGILGQEGYNVEVETFHSFANSIVLESVDAVNYVKNRLDMTEIEKIRALEYTLDNANNIKALKPFGAPYIHLREIQSRISELKNEGISPEKFKKQLEKLAPDEVTIEDKHIKRLKALSLIYEKYEKLKSDESALLFDERGRKDYDDMILIALEALGREQALMETFRKQYKYIMVDEYQDTNGAQLGLLFHILDPKKANLCCVGDDDQAIYRFQGASLANFRILKERFPSLKTVVLKNNYRSTENIVRLSTKIISQLPEAERIAVKDLISQRKQKNGKINFLEFLTEEEELAFLISRIKKEARLIKKDVSLSAEERQKPYNNIAILVRKRNQRQKVIEAFLKAGIPYAADGNEDMRQEKRVRQMLDVLEVGNVSIESNEKKSLALYKILSADYIGASHSDILKFIGFVNSRKYAARNANGQIHSSFNLFQEFQNWFPVNMDNAGVPTALDSKNLEITKKLELKNPHALHVAAWAIKRLLCDAKTRPVHDMLIGYIEDAGLYSLLLKHYAGNQILKIRDLRALVSFINKIKESTLARPSLRLSDFIKELELREVHGMPIEGELATLSQDGVRIYTAHSAKGLEFHTVFMPFCLERQSWPVKSKSDTVPLPPEIYRTKEKIKEKERLKLLKFYDELRLFYVASTRAKATLIYTATPGEKAIESRFLTHLDLLPEHGSPKKEDEFLLEFLKGDTARDPFRDIPAILKDVVKRTSLTPTKLNNYLECKRKFMLNYILGLPGKKTSHLAFGNCAHKALEETYSYYMKNRNFPEFGYYKDVFKRELEFQGVNDTIKGLCLERMETLKNWYDMESKNPTMPFSLETDFEVLLADGLLFKGKLDKLEMEKDGTVRVIDYKTGLPDKHVKAMASCRDISTNECDGYYRQLIAYKLVFDKSRGKENKQRITRGVLQFLEPAAATVKKYNLEKGCYRDIVINLTDDMVLDLEKLIAKCWKDIQNLKFEKLSERDAKKSCARCNFDSICWG